MVNAKLGPMLTDLGQHVADLLGFVPQEAMLYVEAGEGWKEAGIFSDIGEKIVYRDPDDELIDAINALWELEEADKRWSVMIYKIENSRFDADFLFPDQIDDEESSFERRERVLAERYGDKPVDYSEF